MGYEEGGSSQCITSSPEGCREGDGFGGLLKKEEGWSSYRMDQILNNSVS